MGYGKWGAGSELCCKYELGRYWGTGCSNFAADNECGGLQWDGLHWWSRCEFKGHGSWSVMTMVGICLLRIWNSVA